MMMDLEELEKCLDNARKLKNAVLEQQQKILQQFVRSKINPRRQVCPMCEVVFEHIEYEQFEQHVIEHFVTNQAINSY